MPLVWLTSGNSQSSLGSKAASNRASLLAELLIPEEKANRPQVA
jgi:hypothetical protein